MYGTKEAAASAIATLDGQWLHGELFNVLRFIILPYYQYYYYFHIGRESRT